MDKEIIKVILKKWDEYTDETYSDDISFKDFMRFLEENNK